MVVKGVVGANDDGFPNSSLGGGNAGCTGVAELWVIVFGESRSASARDGVAFDRMKC